MGSLLLLSLTLCRVDKRQQTSTSSSLQNYLRRTHSFLNIPYHLLGSPHSSNIIRANSKDTFSSMASSFRQTVPTVGGRLPYETLDIKQLKRSPSVPSILAKFARGVLQGYSITNTKFFKLLDPLQSMLGLFRWTSFTEFSQSLLASSSRLQDTPSSRNGPLSQSSRAASPTLSHLTGSSEAHMISVAHKGPTSRAAVAIGHVMFSNIEVLDQIRAHRARKGDVLAVARVAGIMTAKKTSDIIPLCHPGISIEGVEVEIEAVGSTNAQTRSRSDHTNMGAIVATKSGDAFRSNLYTHMGRGIGEHGGVRISCTVRCHGKTGVEMEALTGVMGAALTIVDMCKSMDKGMSIQAAKTIRKEGGKSGSWASPYCDWE